MDTLLPCLISTDKSSLRVFVVLFISSITEFSHISNQFLLLGNREQLDPIARSVNKHSKVPIWHFGTAVLALLGFRQSINLILWNSHSSSDCHFDLFTAEGHAVFINRPDPGGRQLGFVFLVVDLLQGRFGQLFQLFVACNFSPLSVRSGYPEDPFAWASAECHSARRRIPGRRSRSAAQQAHKPSIKPW